MLFSFFSAELAAAGNFVESVEVGVHLRHPSGVLFVKSDKSQSVRAVLDDTVVDNFANMQDKVDSERSVHLAVVLVV